VAPTPLLVPKTKRNPRSGVFVWLIHSLVLLAMLPALARASQETKQPLGSLSAVGQVYVGNSAAPAESTIFAGDTLRTDPTATATFTMSGRGSFAVASNSQLVFAGTPQYVAELKSGIVVMSSASGTAGINVRASNYVVVAVNREEQTAAKVESAADGSFLITCSEGSVGIVPLQGPPNGVFLQKGQSITISPQGELSSPTAGVVSTAATPAAPSAPSNSPSAGKSNHTALVVLGVAGGAGAIAAAVAASHGGQAVSSSSP
jgi:ferric-dicitrate binding protein FerR (iron transport regulator)